MTERDTFMQLMDISVNTYYLWRRQGRLVLNLLDKYFTKEDLEEFVTTGKIAKFDGIENSKLVNHIRESEIIKLLSKYQAEDLALPLAKSLESNQVISGTSKRLHKTKSKLDFLKEVEKVLSDLSSEISKGEDTTFQSVIDSFNEEIGFDFNRDDKSVVYHIIVRYRVYNTLYDLDV